MIASHSAAKVKALIKMIKGALAQGLTLPAMIELEEDQLVSYADRVWMQTLLMEGGIEISISEMNHSIKHLKIVRVFKVKKRKAEAPE